MDEKKQVEEIQALTPAFPGNSHKKEKDKKEGKKLDKIIKGSVVSKKKPLGKRISETFGGANAGEVFHYIMYDVVLPATKSTIADMVSGGIEMLLFGETKGRRTTRDRGKSYVSYDKRFAAPARRDDREAIASRNRARMNFNDIILESRGEAEEVLSALVDLVETYGLACVSDLYDLVGVTSAFTDEKWGWTNLSAASVCRVREGYLIDLPKPVEVN